MRSAIPSPENPSTPPSKRDDARRARRDRGAGRNSEATSLRAAPEWLFVAAGGAAGALARGGLDALAEAFPLPGAFAPVASLLPLAWSTLLVDLAGAFLLGALSALLARRAAPTPGLVRLRLFAATGFAGAFTTYGTLIGATGRAMIDGAGRSADGPPAFAPLFGAAAASLLLLILGVVSAASGRRLARSLRSAGGAEPPEKTRGARAAASAERGAARAKEGPTC